MKTLFLLCMMLMASIALTQTTGSAKISVCAGSPNFILNEELNEQCSKRNWVEAGKYFADNVAMSLLKELKKIDRFSALDISKSEIVETDTLPYITPEYKRYISLTTVAGQLYIAGKSITDGCVLQYAFRRGRSPKLLKTHKLDETILPQGAGYTVIIWPLYWAYSTFEVNGNKSFDISTSFFWTIYNDKGDLILSSNSEIKMSKSLKNGDQSYGYSMLCDETAKVIAGSLEKKWDIKN